MENTVSILHAECPTIWRQQMWSEVAFIFLYENDHTACIQKVTTTDRTRKTAVMVVYSNKTTPKSETWIYTSHLLKNQLISFFWLRPGPEVLENSNQIIQKIIYSLDKLTHYIYLFFHFIST